ncbi:hypothetical protein GC177_03095 [bacterium]|nr:hypothetical protein [bacterium]
MKQITALVLMLTVILLSSAVQAAPKKTPNVPDELEDVTLMNVGKVEVVNEYKLRNEPPYVDPQFPVPLADSIADWAKSSFVATGEEGVLKIIIREASLQESHYEDKPRFFGLFPGKRMDKYLATAMVEMKLYNGEDAMPVAETEATATREGRIESVAGVGYREELFNTMADDLVDDLDQQTRALTYKFFHERVKD